MAEGKGGVEPPQSKVPLAHPFYRARVRQPVPLQPGRNLQITVGRMAANVLAYFAEGESGVTPRSRARCQVPGARATGAGWGLVLAVGLRTRESFVPGGLGSGESLAPGTQPLMPRLSIMY